MCVLEHSGCGNQFTKKVKTPHGFPLLYLIHSGVMCSGVLFGLIEVYGSGRSWLWKWSQKKKVKHHMVFLLFYCISFRCRLLEGFGFGFVFFLSFSCRLLEGFGCGGEFTKKNLEWMFWKVLAVKTNSQKKVKTPHGLPHFLWYLMHSGVMFSGFSGLLEVYGSGRSWLWKCSQK